MPSVDQTLLVAISFFVWGGGVRFLCEPMGLAYLHTGYGFLPSYIWDDSCWVIHGALYVDVGCLAPDFIAGTLGARLI